MMTFLFNRSTQRRSWTMQKFESIQATQQEGLQQTAQSHTSGLLADRLLAAQLQRDMTRKSMGVISSHEDDDALALFGVTVSKTIRLGYLDVIITLDVRALKAGYTGDAESLVRCVGVELASSADDSGQLLPT
eukprot:PhM_4_TR1303/c2_g1_i2/m.105434